MSKKSRNVYYVGNLGKTHVLWRMGDKPYGGSGIWAISFKTGRQFVASYTSHHEKGSPTSGGPLWVMEAAHSTLWLLLWLIPSDTKASSFEHDPSRKGLYSRNWSQWARFLITRSDPLRESALCIAVSLSSARLEVLVPKGETFLPGDKKKPINLSIMAIVKVL